MRQSTAGDFMVGTLKSQKKIDLLQEKCEYICIIMYFLEGFNYFSNVQTVRAVTFIKPVPKIGS